MNPAFLIPWIALSVGQGADVASTRHALRSGNCIEANSSVYSAQPSTVRLVATKAAFGAGVTVGAILLKRTGHPTAAKRLTYIVGGEGAVASVWNLSVCR